MNDRPYQLGADAQTAFHLRKWSLPRRWHPHRRIIDQVHLEKHGSLKLEDLRSDVKLNLDWIIMVLAILTLIQSNAGGKSCDCGRQQ